MGTKRAKECETADAVGGVLSEEQATNYRALAARANFLALDRPDLAFASKELCRSFARPTTADAESLKHLVRYMVHQPRLSYDFLWEQESKSIDIYVDTDFAGCHRTRRSTSGGVILMGGHLLKHWSTTQATIALSSGEAELVGILKGASMGLGMQSLARDLGLELEVQVHSDSSAAIGISRRRGLGKIRHIHVGDLWVQERLRNHDFSLHKVLGAENPADIFTKYTDKNTIHKMLGKLHLRFEQGRAESAPQIAAVTYLSSHLTTSRRRLRAAT